PTSWRASCRSATTRSSSTPRRARWERAASRASSSSTPTTTTSGASSPAPPRTTSPNASRRDQQQTRPAHARPLLQACTARARAVFGSGTLFSRTAQFGMVFGGPVNGLSVGAPVKFRGVQVGSVTQIKLSLPGMTLPELRIPVFIEIDQDLVSKLGGMINPAEPTSFAALIDEGLRAQLQLESIVTGVLFVELDLVPGSPVNLYLPTESGYLEIPTQPTLLQEASQTGADLIAKLRDVDFDGLVTSVRDAARSVADLAGSPELRQTLVAARETMV